MVRHDLKDLPGWPLPDGYHFRPYESGDRRTWMCLWRDELGNRAGDLFDATFGADLEQMPRRCFFLVDRNGNDMGMSTAWFCRHRGIRWGRVHYVAISTEHRGKGLCKCLVSETLRRLRTLGHRRAMLVTQIHRTPAIRAYLRNGFVLDKQDSNVETVRAALHL